jgi:uncharacterized protein
VLKLFSRLFLLATLFCVAVPSALLALKVPARPDGYVTDRAKLLSSSAKARLEKVLEAFDAETTNQLIVVTFPSLEGESLEDFSMQVAKAWRPGRQGRNNGVIFIIFKNDRKMRIEVGYGLEGVLTDALAGQIIRNMVAPPFKQGNYEQGVFAGVTAIIQATQGEYKAKVDAAGNRELTPGEIDARRRGNQGVLIGILMIAAVVSIIDLIRYFGYRFGHREYSARYDFWEWWLRFAILLAILNILFRIALSAMMSSGGRGGSGGFSGGGGSFGGGGANGRW